MEAIINTAIDTSILYYLNNTPEMGNKLKTNAITDFIFLGFGNFILSSLANNYSVSGRLNSTLKAAYFPTTSMLLFSGYSSIMYNHSYVRSMSVSIPITLAETYINYKEITKQKQETQTQVQNFFQHSTLTGKPIL